MSFYTNLQSTALKLLTDKGKVCTLRKQTSGAYNPATGISAITNTDYSIVGVLLNYSRSQLNEIETMVEVNDRKAIIQGSVTPDVSDLFIFDGMTYRIISIKTVNPAGVAVIHELQVRI